MKLLLLPVIAIALISCSTSKGVYSKAFLQVQNELTEKLTAISKNNQCKSIQTEEKPF